MPLKQTRHESPEPNHIIGQDPTRNFLTKVNSFHLRLHDKRTLSTPPPPAFHSSNLFSAFCTNHPPSTRIPTRFKIPVFLTSFVAPSPRSDPNSLSRWRSTWTAGSEVVMIDLDPAFPAKVLQSPTTRNTP
ncbi:hypothetical protein OIU77_024784 [Salix suchowensis]|uniref:Uncharacterized protein n=1 Tax=Salix suchowensis TaxID=1278906 RepID=A0ABQ9BTY3_9ROSI|nr:hypothetical protein OIU77_024784 [Salix suchowensis]KAJ6390641.1 hypothetical protein OIU77_024784 [Salix suchowensis]